MKEKESEIVATDYTAQELKAAQEISRGRRSILLLNETLEQIPPGIEKV